MQALAKAAGLHYRLSQESGITRVKRGKGFVYRDAAGQEIRDPARIARLARLRIPPGYRDVWISPDPRSHLRATAIDGNGAKQYFYHPRWEAVREAIKFRRVVELGRALPKVREAVARDLALPGLPKAKVLATLVRLLDLTRIRIGHEEYKEDFGTYGLTTLRFRHATVEGSRVNLSFPGKKKVKHDVDVEDAQVAAVVAQLKQAGRGLLFRYRGDDGRRGEITAADVNAYLREVSGAEISAKDFRTWHATVIAARELQAKPRPDSADEREDAVDRAIEVVAENLRNDPRESRKSYVDPRIEQAFEDDELAAAYRGTRAGGGRTRDENAVLKLLDGASN